MNRQLKHKFDDLQKIVKDYRTLKDKIGKKKVLQRVKIRLRAVPDNETKVMVAFQTTQKLNPYSTISGAEVARRIECLTDLSEFEINAVIGNNAPTLMAAGITKDPATNEEIRRKEIVIDPEDAAINEYCEVELKRKYQHNLNDLTRAYS